MEILYVCLVDMDKQRPWNEIGITFVALQEIRSQMGELEKTIHMAFWQVQKPGVDRVLKADLGFLFIAARTLEFLSPELATWLVSEHHFVQTFSDSFLNERLFIFVPQCYCCPPQGSSPATTCPSQTVMYLISSHQPLAYYAFLHEWPLS